MRGSGFTINADDDVPYAKVVEFVEALKASGVTHFSFAEACVGDGKYRVANRTGSYKFDDELRFLHLPAAGAEAVVPGHMARERRPASEVALSCFRNASDKRADVGGRVGTGYTRAVVGG